MTRWANKIPKEAEEQEKLANYLDMKKLIWCHVPNGGNRNVVTGAKLKKQGTKRGVPDVLIFEPPAKRPHRDKAGVAIELKRQKGGRLTKHQKEWLEKLKKCNWVTRRCNGADQAIDLIEKLY